MRTPWLSVWEQKKVYFHLTVWGWMQTIFCSICCGKFIFMDYILQENVTKSWGGGKIERAIEEEGERERDMRRDVMCQCICKW